MFADETAREIGAAAEALGIEPAALLAVAEVESGGAAFALVEGRQEPLIRFEGHYFDRRLSASDRALARAERLAAPAAGAVANPAGQAARWALLRRAMAIDRDAALESTAWGIGQVMGAHWRLLSYADVEALVADVREGLAGQVRLMARYIEATGLSAALLRHDWAAFARGYNGPAYARNAYDRRLADAWRAHSGARAAPAPESQLLARGARGEAVRDLQAKLMALGYGTRADGLFGPATERVVKAFQSAYGLAADGIAGPLTLAALAAEFEAGGPLTRLFRTTLARLRRLVGG